MCFSDFLWCNRETALDLVGALVPASGEILWDVPLKLRLPYLGAFFHIQLIMQAICMQGQIGVRCPGHPPIEKAYLHHKI